MSYMTGDFPVTADDSVVGRVNIAQIGLKLVFDCACDYSTHDILRLAAVCLDKYVPLGVMVPEAGILRTKKSFTKNALMSAGYQDPVSFHLIKPGDVYSAPEAKEPVPPEPIPEPIVYNDFPDPEDYVFDYDENGESTPALQSEEPVPDSPDTDTAAPLPEPAADTDNTVPETVDGWMSFATPGILFDDQTIQEACEGLTNTLITERDGHVLLAVPVLPTEPFPLMPVFCFGSSGQVGGQEYIIFKIKNGSLSL